MKNLNEILFDGNEKIVSVLGNNTVQKFLTTGILGNGFAVLSDKRLYFRGKCLNKKGKTFQTSLEERAVDIKDVTGTGFEHSKPIGLLIGGIACVVIGILIFIVSVPSVY